MPKKPTKRGFKIWVRSDSTNGFISDFEVYTGKGEGGSTETGLGSKVVKKLSRALVGGNYHLYFDNFFSSIPLMEELLQDSLYCCGTFRKDRKFIPKEITAIYLSKYNTFIHNNNSLTEDLQRGEFLFRQCGNLVVCVWKDNRLVYIMSTNWTPTDTTTVRRRDKDGNTHNVPAPNSIKMYNRYYHKYK